MKTKSIQDFMDEVASEMGYEDYNDMIPLTITETRTMIESVALRYGKYLITYEDEAEG